MQDDMKTPLAVQFSLFWDGEMRTKNQNRSGTETSEYM